MTKFSIVPASSVTAEDVASGMVASAFSAAELALSKRDEPLKKFEFPFSEVFKRNPYHDASGRFTSKDKVGTGVKKPKYLGDNASLADYAKTTDDPTITPEKVMANFSKEVQKEVAEVLDKAKSLPPTHQMPELRTPDGSDWSDKRKALHDDIINKILSDENVKRATPAKGEAPKFVVLGGRGGSGKSAFTHKENEDGGITPAKVKEFDSTKMLVIDSDAIKERLIPPYQGWNAASVHEESSQLFDRVTEMARDRGLNIIHDMTLKSMNAEKEIKRFKEQGYDVEGHYMHVPRQESARRGVQRYLGKDGKRSRLVPVDVMLSMTKNEENFDKLKPYFSKWSAYDNQGSAPVLLTRSKP